MAGLGKKTFTAGEVLTASDVNGYLMEQSVMVFGGTAARSSAIPTPSEGMVSYRTDSDILEFYNGSTWGAVAPTPEAAGLTLVKTQTVGSAVSSVQVTDAFTSSYNKYRIIYYGGTGSANNDITLQLGASTTGYYSFGFLGAYNSSSISGVNRNNASNFGLAGIMAFTNKQTYLDVELLSPNLATPTRYFDFGYIYGSNAGMNVGYHSVETAYTDFTLGFSGSTATGGTIYVYGFKK